MKIFILGKVASITHWLEDCAAAFRADGHEVRIGATRDPRVSLAIETVALSPLIGSPMARRLAGAVRRFEPDLILAIGAYHIPPVILAEIAAMPGRAPLIGWVGDRFDRNAAPSAAVLDAVAYTDSGLVALHGQLGFSGRALWLPHAIDPNALAPRAADRRETLVLIANPTHHRRAVVAGLTQAMALYGPGWSAFAGAPHEIHARRVPPGDLAGLYAAHFAALNIRNELNALDGLNQRAFAPCLQGTPVVAEDQIDLAACFEPGRETFVWRTPAELDDLYARLRADPGEAAEVGERARRRVLADHTFARRLEALRALQ